MAKQILHWKRVVCRNVRNSDFKSQIPDIVSSYYNGELLSEILKMPRKKPISFERAVQIVNDKQIDAMKKGNGKECNWYYGNFVQFISDSGFHIEITGDEFVFHLSQDLGT